MHRFSVYQFFIFLLILISTSFFAPLDAVHAQNGYRTEHKEKIQMPYPDGMKKESYVVDLAMASEFRNHVAIMALLSGKAKAIMDAEPLMPKYEKQVYKACERSAKTPAKMANCVVKLMNTRDRIKAEKKLYEQNSGNSNWDTILDWAMPWQRRSKRASGFSEHQNVDEKCHRPRKNREIRRSPVKTYRSRSFIQESEPENDPILSRGSRNGRHAQELGLNHSKRLEKYQYSKSHKPPNPFLQNRLKIKKLTRFSRRMRSVKENAPRRYQDAPYKPIEKCYPLIEKVKTLHEYTQNKQYVEKFMKNTNKENSKFLQKMGFNVKLDYESDKKQNLPEEIFDIINSYLRSANISEFEGINVLAPRIMPFYKTKEDKRLNILSPDILSFQKDGLLSWPLVLKLLTGKSRMTREEWFEFVMRQTGGDKAIEQTFQIIGMDNIKQMMETIYPRTKKLEQMDKDWAEVEQSYNCRQKRSMDKYGYAMLDPEQIELAYKNNEFFDHHGMNLTEYAALSYEDREALLEDDIRKLGELSNQDYEYVWEEIDKSRNMTLKKRTKRQQIIAFQSTIGGKSPIPSLSVLSPSAFTQTIDRWIILRATALSPAAFFYFINVVEILHVHVLSPAAFQFFINNPIILYARIISPSAFRMEILHPRILHAWVLSPTGFALRVLSPRILQVRVMSGLQMVLNILSPGIVHPRAGSFDGPLMAVLSPQIASPRILSPNFILINVLSPPVWSDPLDGI